MQPKLYIANNSTTYEEVINAYFNTSATNSYYLGKLECLSCEHTEERNGVNDLTLTVLASNYLANDLTPGNLIMAKVPVAAYISDRYDTLFSEQFFKIYNVERNLDEIQVQAHHISYELSFKPVNMFTSTSSSNDPYVAFIDLKNNTPNSPFKFSLAERDFGTVQNFSVTKPGSARKWLGGIEGSILDLWPGEFFFDNLTVRYYKNRGSSRTKKIKYGKNLSEFDQKINGDDYYLGAYAFVEKDGVYVTAKTNNGLTNTASRWAVLDFTSDYSDSASLPTEAQLRTKANNYIYKNQKNILDVSLDINYKPSSLLKDEPIFLCDTVNIQFEKYGINTNLKVVRVVYDVLREKNISIELNQPKKTLADTVANLQITQQNYSGAVASANANRAAARAANILLGNEQEER